MDDAPGAEWIAIRPNTDAAFMLALAHTWVSGGLHDRAFLDRYCVACHNPRLATAGLVLETASVEEAGQKPEILEKVVHRLRSGTMPPPGARQPEPMALELRSPSPSSIEGAVVDEGERPVAEAEVVLEHSEDPLRELDGTRSLPSPELSAVTDGEGRFAFRGLEAGTYGIDVAHPDFLRSVWTPVHVNRGERRSDVRVTLEPGFRIRGRKFFQCHHAIQNSVALDLRAFRIFQRRQPIRAPDQSRQERCFREIQF